VTTTVVDALAGIVGAFVSVCPKDGRSADYYGAKLARYPALPHVIVEIQKSYATGQGH